MLASLYAAAILWSGLYICREALFVPSGPRWFSMHGEWLGIARLAGVDWFWPHWFRWQGGGAPLHFLYAPLVPFLLALGDGPRVLNGLTAAVYVLSPAVLFAVLWRLLRSPGAALAAALFYLLFSPTELFLPDADWKLPMFLSSRRFYLLWEWDELPHAMAVMLAPVLGWLLLRGRFAAAVLCSAVMMLSSMFGLVLSGLVAATVTLATGRLAWAPAAGWLLVCPWLTPSLLWAIRRNSVLNAEVPAEARPLWALTCVVTAVAAVWLATRRMEAERRWVLLIACPFLLIPVLFQHAVMHFIPQAGRYKVEAELAVAMLLGLGLSELFRRAPRWVSVLVMLPLVWFGAQQVVTHRRFAKRELAPAPAERHIEQRAAEWLAANLRGRRVMLSGSMAAWANAFADVDQIGGISYPTIPNYQQQVVINSLHWGKEPGPAIESLRRFGASAVAVPGPKSPEFWHPYESPGRFEGVLPVLWREEDTTIYEVPGVAAGPEWVSQDHARVTGRGTVRVAVNAMPGWRASRGSIRADELGLMQIETGCSAPCTVDLTYEGAAEDWMCRLVSVATLAWLLWRARR